MRVSVVGYPVRSHAVLSSKWTVMLSLRHDSSPLWNHVRVICAYSRHSTPKSAREGRVCGMPRVPASPDPRKRPQQPQSPPVR